MKSSLIFLFCIALILVACSGQATPTLYVPAEQVNFPVTNTPTTITTEEVDSALDSQIPTASPDCSSNLLFLQDITIPDGTQVQPEERLDKRWLATHGVDADRLAGIASLSGQAITHVAVREERGIKRDQPVIDELAPLYHVRADAPPLLIVTGDRDLELLGRYEENAYMMRMMKVAGHKDTRIFELDGYGHGMTAPAFPLLIKEVQRICKQLDRKK